jgi:hypothetical protein
VELPHSDFESGVVEGRAGGRTEEYLVSILVALGHTEGAGCERRRRVLEALVLI